MYAPPLIAPILQIPRSTAASWSCSCASSIDWRFVATPCAARPPSVSPSARGVVRRSSCCFCSSSGDGKMLLRSITRNSLRRSSTRPKPRRARRGRGCGEVAGAAALLLWRAARARGRSRSVELDSLERSSESDSSSESESEWASAKWRSSALLAGGLEAVAEARLAALHRLERLGLVEEQTHLCAEALERGGHLDAERGGERVARACVVAVAQHKTIRLKGDKRPIPAAQLHKVLERDLVERGGRFRLQKARLRREDDNRLALDAQNQRTIEFRLNQLHIAHIGPVRRRHNRRMSTRRSSPRAASASRKKKILFRRNRFVNRTNFCFEPSRQTFARTTG
jgi:hypothetical protein